MRHRLAALQIADPPSRWEALGFALTDDEIDLGGVRLQLGASGHGIVAWALDPPVAEIDGLPTFAPRESGQAGCSSDQHMATNDHLASPSMPAASPSMPATSPSMPAASPSMPASGAHPNGAIGLDHVVVATPDFERTAHAFQDAGLPFRRIRDAGSFRQGFRRLGPAILEVVEATAAPPGLARFWGLVVVVADLQALSRRLTDRLGEMKSAVQPGRHIATVSDSAGLQTKVAFMDPEQD